MCVGGGGGHLVYSVQRRGVTCHLQGGRGVAQILIFPTYRIYSLIRRTIFHEKICLFDENLLKTRGASYNRVFSRNEI